MDVRQKQRLSYRVVLLPLACAVAVSAHVISIVGRFVASTNRALVNEDDYRQLSRI